MRGRDHSRRNDSIDRTQLVAVFRLRIRRSRSDPRSQAARAHSAARLVLELASLTEKQATGAVLDSEAGDRRAMSASLLSTDELSSSMR